MKNRIILLLSMLFVTGMGLEAQPSLTLGTMPTLCAGDTTALLTYSVTGGTPVYYSIRWTDTASAAGFVGSPKIITTVAGNNAAGLGYSGDGGAATAATLSRTQGITFDASGNLYIADGDNNVIRKITPTGVISTVAGNNGLGFGFAGDGGAATNAQLFFPTDVAVDASGNIYIADQGNQVIRKVNPSGVISTVAGMAGVSGYSGDGAAATAALLNGPENICVDASGNLYISDLNNNVIRRVVPSGTISTVAGNNVLGAGYSGDGGDATAAQLNNPEGITIDALGNLYIADLQNNVVRKITSSGVISTVAGDGSSLGYGGDGGAATAAQLHNPSDVAIDAFGNIYFTDLFNNVVRKVTPSGIITTVAGTGSTGYSGDGGAAIAGQLNYSWGVASDALNNIYISDQLNYVIRKVTTSVVLTSSPLTLAVPSAAAAGTYNGTLTIYDAGGAYANYTISVNVATSARSITGNTAICSGNTTLLNTLYSGGTWSSTNTSVASVGSTGIVAGISGGTSVISYQLSSGCGVTTATTTVNVNVTPSIALGAMPSVCMGDTLTHLTYSAVTGGPAYNIKWDDSATAAGFAGTPGIITTIAGNASSGSGFSGDGGAATTAQLNGPFGVTADADGNVYIADQNNQVVRKVTPSGTVSTVAGNNSLGAGYSGDGGSATAARLNNVSGVVADASGNLYIADAYNNVIRKVTLSGIISTVAGNNGLGAGYSGDGGAATAAQLSTPVSVATDASGNLYIADQGNSAIRRVTPAGIISTVAGNGSMGYSGDGSAATDAQLFFPFGVTTDVTGNLFIADYLNDVIRKVTPAGIISTFAGNGSVGYSGDGSSATAAELSYPTAVSTDAAGNLYIADYVNSVVRMVTPSGVISTVAGDGTLGAGYSGDGGIATAAQITYPTGVGTDAVGNLYIADGINSVIRKVTYTATLPASPVGISVPAAVSPGTYHGNLSVYNGSCNTSYPISVSVDHFPDSGIITGAATICASSGTTLNDTITGGYWSSSNTAVAIVGSVSGVTAGVSAGTTTISYSVTNSCGTAYATRIVTVNPLPVAGSISGSPAVCEGVSITLTDGISGGVWSSSNTSVATVAGGVVTGVLAGTAIISYTVANGCGTAYATQVVTVNAAPTAGSISGSSGVCESATVTLTDGTGGGVWSSSNMSAATVAGGVVTGVSAGTAIISYTIANGCGTAYATQAVTINPLPVAGSIGGTASVCAGSVTTLTDGIGGGAWSSSNTSIGTVSGGVVTGVSAGTTLISYAVTNGCGTAYAFATVTVNTVPATSPITGVSPICVGTNITLSDAVAGGIWSSSNAGVAIIGSGTGVATGMTTGTAIITYSTSNSCGSSFVTTIVSVNPASPISGATIVCSGSTTTLSDTSSGGIWSSSNTSVATADSSSGIVSGVSAGTAIISYAISSGCTSVTTVTILSVPVISPITGPTTVCTGNTTTLSDATPGGFWYSTNNAIATVGFTGVVGGAASGIVAIVYAAFNSCGIGFNSTYVTVTNTSPITGTLTVCESATTTLSDATPGGVWSSGNTAIATIGSASGIAAGVAAGTVVISYSISCGVTTKVVTVNPIPVAGTIIGSSAVCEGATTTLTDGASGGVWSSSNTSVATVSGGVVSGVLAGTSTISYTVTNGCGTAVATQVVTVNALPVAGSISGSSSVCESATITLTESASGGVWSSSNTSAATVSGGIVSGVLAGTTTISYTVTNGCGTVYATKDITVNPVPVAGTISGSSAVCEGATATLTDGASGGVWSSSNTSVATVSGGVVSGVLAGTTTISYTVTNGCGTAVATQVVTVNALPVAGSISGSSSLCESATITLTESASGGVWSSSNTSVATVSGGIVSGVLAGTTIISYTVTNGCGTVYATQNITVNPAPVAGTIIGSSTVCEGASTTLTDGAGSGVWSSSNTSVATVSGGVVSGVLAGTTTISYTVTNGCGTVYATQNITVSPMPVAGTISGLSAVCESATITLTDGATGGIWSSSNTSVATVSGGVVTGVLAGTATISYTVTNGCGTVYATQDITVNPIPVAGTIIGSSAVCEGATTTLTDGASGGVWSSSNTSVATVSGGIVSGVLAGTTTISYTVTNGCGTAIATQIVTVNALPVAGSIVGSSSLCESATITLTDGATGGVWSSSNTSVATVSGGVVTGVLAGTTTISYTVTNGCGTAYASQDITVNPVPVAGTIIGSFAVCESATTTLTDGASGGVWSSSNTSVATVSGGIVSGVLAGTTTISYTVTNGCGTAIATQIVTVNALPVAGSIVGPSSLCESATITLTDGATGGVWSSSNTSVATVSSGIVSGVLAGTTTISYTVTNGCGTAIATQIVTVNALPVAGSISGSSSVCESSTTTLTDGASGGVWSSSNTSVATVSGGVVSGVLAGTTTISYTVTNGCGTAYATQNITVNPVPVAGTISGSSAVCESSTITLTDGATGGIWSSNNTSVATVSGGVVTGVLAGTTTISYTVTNGCGTVYATQDITVNPLPLAGTISGSSAVCESATITLTDGASGGVWSSSNTSVATLSGGVVTGVLAGTTAISYSVTNGCGTAYAIHIVTVNPLPNAGSISGPSTVGVTLSITLTNTATGGVWSASNANATITGGGLVAGVLVGIDTISYTATNGCGTAIATATITVINVTAPITGTTFVCTGATTALSDVTGGGIWSSNNSSVATVGSLSGVVTGVSVGTSVITYTASAGFVTSTITVNQSPSTITGTTTVCALYTTTVSNTVTGGGWSSSNTSVASIDAATGIVSGVAGGTATITYMMSTGCYSTTTLLVNPLAPIAGSTGVCSGSSIALSDLVSGGAWSSSNAATATVGAASGIVTGVAASGTVTITYTLSTGCVATAMVTVNPLPSAVTGTAIFCAGTTSTLSDATGGGVWCSGNTAIATVGSSTGVVTGVSGGLAAITYKLATGCLAIKAVTVNPAVTAIGGATSLCMFSTGTLTNGAPGGTWVSGNTSVVTIGSASGFVTGVSIGTAIVTYTAICGTVTGTVTVGGIPAVTAVSSYVDTVLASVTITGSSFNTIPSSNIVYFGATKGTVTSASGTSLTVTVPVDATYSPVSVENTGCLLTAYSQYPVLPGYNNSAYIATSIVFTAKVDFTAGSNPFNIAIGDIDGDGKADMVVTNYTSNTISVYRNTSSTGSITSGSFAAKVDFATGTSPYGLAIADLDNDGKLDIAVANNGSVPPTISVFHNTATSGSITSSSLSAKVDFTVGAGPIAVAIGDIDKDGKPDIAVANYGANTVSLLRNVSTSGTITSSSFAAKVDLATASHPFSVAIGDMDGDGKQDLVVPNQGAASVSVFRNTAAAGSITSGSFAAKVDFTTGSNPYSVVLGDIDGDGKMEIAVANNSSNSVSVFRNTSTSGAITSGSFATKVDFTTGTAPYSVAMGDINGDGKVDLIIANSSSNSVSVLRNTSTSGTISSSSFAAKTDFATGVAPRCVAVGDLDGDYKADIAIANISSNTVSVLRNNPTFHPSSDAGATHDAVIMCVGATVTLNEVVSGGVWTSGNNGIAAVDLATGVVTGIAAGRTIISYTDGNIISTTPVIVNPIPDAVIITATPGTNIRIGQSVTLTANVLNGGTLPVYQWLLNGVAIPGATNKTYVNDRFANNDEVACTVGSSTGCGDFSITGKVVITVQNGNDNLLISSGSNITLLPNPNAGTFNLKGSLGVSVDAEISVEITNMLGQVIYKDKIMARNGKIDQRIQMDNATLSNGMYLLNIISDNEHKTFHMVIEK